MKERVRVRQRESRRVRVSRRVSGNKARQRFGGAAPELWSEGLKAKGLTERVRVRQRERAGE